jgi:hypothetical protein
MKKRSSLLNELSVRGIEEGLEETLTLRRLDLVEKLAKSLKTTNGVEFIIVLEAQKTDTVDYWRNSDQRQRLLSPAFLDIEPRLNRIRGRIKGSNTNRTSDEGKGGGSCIMDNMGRCRIATKKGIDSHCCLWR